MIQGDRVVIPSDILSNSENGVDTNERGRKELEQYGLDNISIFPNQRV